MKKQLATLTLLVFVAASFGTIYELTITTHPQLNYSNLELHQGATNPLSLSTNPTHQISILDVFEDIVYKKNYSVQEYISYTCLEEDCEDTIHYLAEPEIQASLPYYSNAKEIVVQELSSDQELRIDVTHLSNYCGNGICNRGHNDRTCPQDCLIILPEENQPNRQGLLYWILAASVLAIIGEVYRKRN